ncbi:terpene synthase family protein [Nannocystis pusilla]|uniref:Terpene synthase family protein n=1 Tax=Nannocystis pusilla TaxID=889268 RepID=A0ABS7TM22_9BACT|nr:terpene synthase family protein [Nannocystis pusilla]MBZ5709241.1 terpene synthase family protein [Nannocystis pusilla]
MSRIAAAVDQAMLARIMAWAADFEDFAVHHAADGLYVAEACVDPDVDGREEVFAIALVSAFWFWFDDRSDKFLREAETPVDWDTLIAYGDDEPPVGAADTPEVRFFQRLCDLLAPLAERPDDHRWFRVGSAKVFRAMFAEERMSRDAEARSLVECIETGAHSTTLPSILTAAYLVRRLDRPRRLDDPRVANIERYLYLSQRLLNDLKSAEKERREGHAGRVSNSVLLLERDLSPAQARAFVEAQRRGYERLLQHNLDRLGTCDPFAATLSRLVRCIQRWYATGPLRFETDPAR